MALVSCARRLASSNSGRFIHHASENAAVARAIGLSCLARDNALLPSATARAMSTSPTKKSKRAVAKQLPAADGSLLRPFTVALVGRPNVGKSSLFNRLTGTRLAIVDDTPGTTRDWKEAAGRIGGLQFTVMDTGGLEDREGGSSIESRMLEHTRAGLAHADVVLFIVDARAGVSGEDQKFARWVKRLRAKGAGIHLVANKTEGWSGRADGEALWDQLVSDCYPLGLGEPTGVSSSQGDGLEDLYRLLEPYARTSAPQGGDGAATAKTITASGDAAEPGATAEVTAAAAAAPTGAVETDDTAPPSLDAVDSELDRGTGVALGSEWGTFLDEEGRDMLPADPTKRKAVAARLARAADGPVQLAIVGRPNAGKSTLVNQLLGEERVMAGPTPGLTRDAVTVDLPLADGRTCRLVDTAGMRRWGAWDLSTPLEGAAVGLARRALQRAHVVALVVDASAGAPAGLTHERPALGAGAGKDGAFTARAPSPHSVGGGVSGWGLTKQDLAIAQQVLDEGRALVVVVNKTDALGDRAAVIDTVSRQLAGMHGGQGAEVIPLSALRGAGIGALMPAVLRTYDRWNARVSTGRLNAWLQQISRHHPPPSVSIPGRTRPGKDGAPTTSTRSVGIRLKYLTQVTARPPTFAVFANRSPLPENYSRYLVNALRREFDLGGVPLRVVVRSAANPFTQKAKAAASKLQQAQAQRGRGSGAGAKKGTAAAGRRTASASSLSTTSLESANSLGKKKAGAAGGAGRRRMGAAQ